VSLREAIPDAGELVRKRGLGVEKKEWCGLS
jgi:hypothetical protein